MFLGHASTNPPAHIRVKEIIAKKGGFVSSCNHDSGVCRHTLLKTSS